MKLLLLTLCFYVVSTARLSEWSQWGPFGPCTRRASNPGTANSTEGFKIRTRVCVAVHVDDDSKNVTEEKCSLKSKGQKQTRRCHMATEWSDFTLQSPCSATCGKKILERSCLLIDGVSLKRGQKNVCKPGDVERKVENCTRNPCPVDGGWSEWSEWSVCGSEECTSKVDMSFQYKTRTCSSPFPVHGGKMCEGSFLIHGLCADPHNCPTNGNWSEWSDWSDWNCEAEQRTRNRTCNNPPPRNGGQYCQGSSVSFLYKVDNLPLFNLACENGEVVTDEPDEQIEDYVEEGDEKLEIDDNENDVDENDGN